MIKKDPSFHLQPLLPLKIPEIYSLFHVYPHHYINILVHNCLLQFVQFSYNIYGIIFFQLLHHCSYWNHSSYPFILPLPRYIPYGYKYFRQRDILSPPLYSHRHHTRIYTSNVNAHFHRFHKVP